MPDPSNITVFVSYAHEDKPYADVLFKELLSICTLDFTLTKGAGNGPANSPTGRSLIDPIVLIG